MQAPRPLSLCTSLAHVPTVKHLYWPTRQDSSTSLVPSVGFWWQLQLVSDNLQIYGSGTAVVVSFPLGTSERPFVVV